MPNTAAILPQFLSRVGALGGPAAEEDRLAAVQSTLRALAARLTPAECARLACDLPDDLREPLDTGCDVPRASLAPEVDPEPVDRIFSRVADELGMPLGRAVEAVQVVCRVVAETIDERTRAVLIDHPDAAFAALFDLPDCGATKTPLHPRRPSSLAEGAPGSRRSVSDAETRSGQPGSVAAWNDARTGRMLGSYHGRTDDTLATGSPGSRRGLSDAS